MFDEQDYCVVGNAPNELGSGNGEIIDTHEFVFRFNNFKTDGFENDYGTKVTHWVTTFAKDIQPREFDGKVFLMCPLPLHHAKYLKRYNYTDVNFLKKYSHNTNFIPVDYYEELIKYVPNPSTGVAMLFWLYKLHGLEQSRIYGFTFFDKSQKHHYFDKASACNHKGDLEQSFYDQLLSGEI